jgi:hypothetical protein
MYLTLRTFDLWTSKANFSIPSSPILLSIKESVYKLWFDFRPVAIHSIPSSPI